MTEQAASLLGSESRSATPPSAYKIAPSTIIHHVSPTSSIAPGHSSGARTLQRSPARLVSGLVVDLILGGAATLFLVLAIIVRMHAGQPVEDHSRLVSSLQEAMQYGSTLFPILFAAAVSRGIKSVLLWKLERGARIGLLDTLAGSSTVFNTLATQFNLRVPSIIGIALVLIWGLSPVGSQASLRIMSITSNYTDHNLTLQYSDTMYWFLAFYDAENTLAMNNALFTASLLSPASTKHSSTDTWGKLKVPMMEELSEETVAADGWMVVPPNTTYSALSGLYISGLNSSRNISTKMETSYMVADCPTVSNSFPTSLNVSWSEGPSANIYSPNNKIMADGTGGMGRNASAGMQPRIVYYQTGLSLPNRNTAYQYDYLNPSGNCTISTSYVELEVSCFGRTCSTLKMRPSRLPHNDTAWTVLDRPRVWEYWSDDFVKSVYGHDSYPTPKEIYFVDPDTAANPSTCGGDSAYSLPHQGCSDAQIARAMDPRAFSISLTQLMNTYWLSGAGPELTTNSLSTESPQMCYQFQPQTDPNCQFVLDASATATTKIEVIACHDGWLIAIIIASAVMIVATVLRLAAALSRRSGDLLFNVSTLMRDNPYATFSHVASTTEDSIRSRLFRTVKVRFGDVRPMSEVGHVGLGVVSDDRAVDRFREGRIFD